MGVKEFAELAGVATPRIHEFLKGKRNLKPESLNAILKPWRLRVKLVIERAS